MLIRNLAVITTIFIFLFAFGCENLTKGKNLDNLSLEEKCKYYEEENAKLMSERPDYEIALAEEKLKELNDIIFRLPEILKEKERMYHETKELKDRLEAEGKDSESLFEAAETKAWADFEMLDETKDDASKYTDEYLQKLQDINAELKSNKYPRITNKSQLKSKKEQLNELNNRINEITIKIPHIDKAEQDNQISKKILEYLKEDGK